ncbi:glycosyltransferase family 4 protein, partial [Candidatus Dojkabacteria bacterium]|nr:glycosyltransferase family 4 protein [Candidatus Dojkabacteria bacterium]
IDPSKIRVVHNAIEKNITPSVVRADMTKQKDEKMVLFLGRLTIAKGADYLLQAAQKVIKVIPDAKFVFVGKGEMIKELIDMSIELGISENIVFTGWLNHEQVDQAYRQADLFVMPSITEPFGLTALEAMRNGTPVLLSRQSGVSEVVQNCLKVDFWDIDAMANKILSVLRYQPLQETLRENGNHDVNHLSWEAQTHKIIDLYNELIIHEQ